MKAQKFAIACSVAASVMLIGSPSKAADLPSNSYISYDNLQWAWAAPVAAWAAYEWGTTFNLAAYAQYGWRLATDAEVALAPAASQFVFPGANTPSGACAAGYFVTGITHCDYGNGAAKFWALKTPTPGQDYYEQLVVRGVPGPVSGAGLTSLLIGSLLLLLKRRQKQA